MVLASLGNTLASPQVSAQMRRLFAAYGCASRQDVLVAQDMDTAFEEEDFEVWVASVKAKRAKKDGGGPGNRGKAPVRGARKKRH